MLLFGAGRLRAGFTKFLWPQDAPPVIDGWDRANRIFFWLLGTFTPFVASTSSVFLGAAIIWVFVSYGRGKVRFALPRQTWLAAAASVIYVFTLSAATARTMTGWSIIGQLMILVPFLAVIFLPPRLWRSPLGTDLLYLASGAANGLYLSLIVALSQIVVLGSRLPYGGRVMVFSGNPVPAAYAIVIFSIVAGLGLERLPPKARLYRLGAIAAGVCAAILTGSISVLASLPVLLGLFWWRYRSVIGPVFRKIPHRRWTAGLLAAGVAGLLALALAYSPFLARFDRYAEAAVSVSNSQEADSLDKRLAMWKAAGEAALHAPLTGYGIQNRFAAIVPYLPPEYAGKISFTHPHNGFLTALVAGGVPAMLATILLLVSPFVMVFRHARGIWREDLLALAFGGAIVYCVAGMTGIMFFQDATDAIYCWIMVFAAVYSAPEYAAIADKSRPADAPERVFAKSKRFDGRDFSCQRGEDRNAMVPSREDFDG